MDVPNIIKKVEKSFDFTISTEQIEQLSAYAAHLRSWSARTRLISRNDRNHVWERHLVDCASLVPRIPSSGSFLDLGSGAGLPGIPVAILLPDLRVTLLEPARMKALFLAEMARSLQLHNVHCVKSRAEDLSSDPSYAQTFVVATARAVAPLPKLWSLIQPLLSPTGLFVAMKGPDPLSEFSGQMPSDIEAEVEEITLPITNPQRSFVKIRQCFT